MHKDSAANVLLSIFVSAYQPGMLSALTREVSFVQWTEVIAQMHNGAEY